MSAEEIADVVFVLLSDLGYKPKTNLTVADEQKYKKKFKNCLNLATKRSKEEFKRILCTYLQELRVTISGRSTFLHVLLCVVEWVHRKRSPSLGIRMPPRDENFDNLRSASAFFRDQVEADRKLFFEMEIEMKNQIMHLVSDLEETENAVSKSRQELTHVQQQKRTLQEDAVNLEKFSKAITKLSVMLKHLKRLLDIVQSDNSSADATRSAELPLESILEEFPQLAPLVNELSEQRDAGQIVMVLCLKLITETLKAVHPFYNDESIKLSTDSTLERLLKDRQGSLERAKIALEEAETTLMEKKVRKTYVINNDLKADDYCVLLEIIPVPADEPEEVISVNDIRLNNMFKFRMLEKH